MAVYSKLLLSAGGGIVSATQQAEQRKNTATVLIGIGGTGIDAISTIKTQLFSGIRPDDPDAANPKYNHIRFIGVDSCSVQDLRQRHERGFQAGIEENEFFSISNAYLREIFRNATFLKNREDLAWLNWEELEPPVSINCSPCGVRQIGRFLMMDKSKEFMHRIEQEINMAIADLYEPTVNIHIFSGLSGGTGSGCFLDVCYMVRHVASRIMRANVFGYFFLPEVNLSLIPSNNPRYEEALRRNGYAAMQELDYCMQFPENRGAFTQKYQDGVEICWDRPPVDICFLIGATDRSVAPWHETYVNAMDVTAQYIIDNIASGAMLTYTGVNRYLRFKQEQIPISANVRYCTLGASCANIPFREINTYLASELFEKFSGIEKNVPDKEDVKKLAFAALARDAQGVVDIYWSLYQDICDGYDDHYSAYIDDWQFVRDYGNSQMVASYTNQTAAKLNITKKNAKSMASTGNQMSLVGRVDVQLRKLVRDIRFGPMFAYGLVSAGNRYNLLDIIDDLIRENTAHWEQEAAQTSLRQEDYDKARDDFDNRRRRSLFDNDAKRFSDYEYYLMSFEQHKLAMKRYAMLDEVLNAFRKQVEELADYYYVKLKRICDTLINTFRENSCILANEKDMRPKGSFFYPMVTVPELKKNLDYEIAQINISGMLDAFMRLFLDNEEAWIGEDENEIAKLVNTFFVETAFGGFANRTITSFLKDKYGITNDAQLANKIYNEWMKKLAAKASPLFYFNAAVWREDQTAKQAFVSIPSSSYPIRAAAKQLYDLDSLWRLKESSWEDRISVIEIQLGFPICSSMFISSTPSPLMNHRAGLYSYEGKPNFGMEFNDWRKLPLLKPN